MTTININLYSIAALVGDEYDGWTPPSVVQGWIDTLVAGHTLTTSADVFADTRQNKQSPITLTGNIDKFLSDDWVYIIPAGTRVSLVVTEPLTSTNHGPYNWAELDPSRDMFSHKLSGVVTVH